MPEQITGILYSDSEEMLEHNIMEQLLSFLGVASQLDKLRMALAALRDHDAWVDWGGDFDDLGNLVKLAHPNSADVETWEQVLNKGRGRH